MGAGGDARESGRAGPGADGLGERPEGPRVDREALGLLHARGAVAGAAAREVHAGVEGALSVGLRLGGRGLSVEGVGAGEVALGRRGTRRGRALPSPVGRPRRGVRCPLGRGRVGGGRRGGPEAPALVASERSAGAVERAPREGPRAEDDGARDPVARGLDGVLDREAEGVGLGEVERRELGDVPDPALSGAGGHDLDERLGRERRLVVGDRERDGRSGRRRRGLVIGERLRDRQREEDGREETEPLDPFAHDGEAGRAVHGEPEGPAGRRLERGGLVGAVGVGAEEGVDVAARADGEQRGRHLAPLVQLGQADKRPVLAGGLAVGEGGGPGAGPLGGRGVGARVALDLRLAAVHVAAGAVGVGPERLG